MKTLLAFDKYKDSMSAQRACSIAEEAISSIFPNFTFEHAPLTDGGEGFCEILTQLCDGKLETHQVAGPLKEALEAKIGFVEMAKLPQSVKTKLNLSESGEMAIVEMAQASGLESVPKDKRNPRNTSTYGTGQLMKIAADKKVDAILLGLGGSATNDIGLGALEALGLKILNEEMQVQEKLTPSDWSSIKKLDADSLISLPKLYIACDVSNPLLGSRGATYVYGPQKGLTEDDKPIFEKEVSIMAERLCDCMSKDKSLINEPSTGAAGGIGFGLRCAYDAEFVSGFDLVEDWLDLETKVKESDIVITGEGRIDESSLEGKGPGSIIRMAQKHETKLLAFPGSVQDEIIPMLSNHPSISIIAISDPDVPLEQALRNGPESLKMKISDTVKTICK